MPNPRDYQFNLPASDRPSGVTIPEQWYPGVQNYWPRCTSQRIVGDHINGVVAVVIHATAGFRSADAVSVMHPPPGDSAASFHWLVPDEDEPQHGQLIWACVRERDAAWHVRPGASHADVNGGRNRVNHWSLGVEIVNRQLGGDAFSDWQVAIVAQLVRYCWSKYPNLRHVVSHAKLDPLRRTDPGANFPWERFKGLVLNPPDDASPNLVTADVASSTSRNIIETQETASLEEEEANFNREESEAYSGAAPAGADSGAGTNADKLHEAQDG
ncbi:MAG TPA: N-acetylmuramoyl-L-alanine amidase [Pyrinomonadaceae bacterium]